MLITLGQDGWEDGPECCFPASHLVTPLYLTLTMAVYSVTRWPRGHFNVNSGVDQFYTLHLLFNSPNSNNKNSTYLYLCLDVDQDTAPLCSTNHQSPTPETSPATEESGTVFLSVWRGFKKMLTKLISAN